MRYSTRASRRRFLGYTGVASAGVAAVALVGCGDDDDEGGATATATSTSGSGTGTATGAASATGTSSAGRTVKSDATLRLNGSDIDSFDAITGTGGNGQQFLWTVFDNLVAYDKGFIHTESRSLAESWEYADPTRLVFTLRSGVKFHDGTDFNAEAVAYNHQHVVTNGARSGAPADLQAIDRVEVVDPQTAVFHMKRPDGGLLTKLGDRPGFQSSPTAIELHGGSFADGNYKRNPVGTGAFKFKGWQEGSFLQVERFADYWQEGNPKVAGIDWRIIPDPNTAFAAFRSGELDLLWALDPKNISAVKDLDTATFKQSRGVSIPSFTLNTARPPFNNPHATRAASFAINRDPIIASLLGGTAVPASTWIAPGNAEFDPNYKGLWYDPEKAKEELALGGLDDGFEFLVCTSETPLVSEMLQVIQAQLAEVGITMKIEFNPGFVARFLDDKIGDAFYAAYSGRAEPSQSFNFKNAKAGVYVSGGTKATSPEFETLLTELESTLDLDGRSAKLYEMADFVNDNGWDLFLWHPDTLVAAQNYVEIDVFGDGKPHLGQGDVTIYEA
jgi:peptide/nickel transport system substrate-binding protein